MTQGSAPRWRALRVRAVVDETHDAKSIVFDLPPQEAESFRYRPGQFLTLRLPVGGRHLPRCYSMSSAPGVDEAPRVTVKRVERGRGSNWLCDHVQPGSVLEVLPPAGVFTPRTLDGDFLLLAGGSGITPVFSILRSALAQGQGRITLIYANRDERSVIFRRELTALAGAHPTRLMVIHWLDSVQGVPSVAQLAELALPFRRGQAFVCGPAPFMDACVAALQGIEMDPAQIHVERFASLPDEEDAAACAPAPAPVDGVDEAEVEVSHQGQLHRITCGGSESILEAALRVGLELPHSCQAGLCASCMCQVVEGKVHLRVNEVLDKKDLSKGWTLACQAVPTSPKVRVRFAE
jgi:3-ketosteroid 9alpha-monooxygenase subunit B